MPAASIPMCSVQDARFCKFINSCFFELILLSKFDNKFPVERFEAAVSQSTAPSPPSHGCCSTLGSSQSPWSIHHDARCTNDNDKDNYNHRHHNNTHDHNNDNDNDDNSNDMYINDNNNSNNQHNAHDNNHTIGEPEGPGSPEAGLPLNK